MWRVRPATMTRRTERLSRLLRLWLTTMPNDFATIPRLSRLSPERLCDFPARVCDFDRAADLPHGVGGFSFSRLIGGGFTGAAWALPGFRPDLKAETFFSPLYCIVQKSVVFQTVASANKKLDKISIKHLTINKTLDILKSSIKHLIPIDEGSFNNAEK